MKLKTAWVMPIASLLAALLVGCDPCSGDIYAHTVSDVEALAGCEVITGDLTVGGGGQLWHVDPLSSLRSVEGALYLYNSNNLANVDGLANLTSVGDFLRISGNASLTNIDGLSSLVSVGDYVDIFDNPVLCQTSIDAFLAGCTIGGSAEIAGYLPGC
jgi:hypothetical protein